MTWGLTDVISWTPRGNQMKLHPEPLPPWEYWATEAPCPQLSSHLLPYGCKSHHIKCAATSKRFTKNPTPFRLHACFSCFLFSFWRRLTPSHYSPFFYALMKKQTFPGLKLPFEKSEVKPVSDRVSSVYRISFTLHPDKDVSGGRAHEIIQC